MMTFAALACSFAGFAALALSLARHHRDVFGALPTRPRTLALRAAGWPLLGLSLATCIAGEGWSIGPVLWFGLLTAMAFALVLLLGLPLRLR